MQKIFRETKSKITLNKSKNPNFPAHIHDDIELIYVKKGGGIACCDGKRYTLTDNSVFLVFPNQVHYYIEFETGDYRVLIVKPSALLRYGDLFLTGVPQHASQQFPAGKDDGILYLLETVYQEFGKYGYSDIIAAYLTALFGKLLAFYPIAKNHVRQDNVLNVLQYCANHYKEDITVATVAENLSISVSCVSHIFSARVGMHFCDYVNSLRLQEAEDLLQNRNYSITEVANRSGFATIRTFNRAFLKEYGVSPSVYQKRL